MDKMIIYILKGSIVTLKLYVLTIVLSIPLGTIIALAKTFKPFEKILGIYTWIFRGTPLLLQLFFLYYGLPVLGIKLTEFSAALITFILNYSAYFAEIIRGGVMSIDQGQYEGAKVLGMNYMQTMRRIILPQAFLRIIPSICNEAINLVKDTALVTVIGMGEILRNSKEIVTREFTIVPFFIAAIIYLGISSLIVIFFRRLEKNNKLATSK
ncbi:amino acid ABC transporter permease [Haloimpatiens massiliensis]|uniref:amino acid ABC transporter permease n=1 Tax=Haloimpatiens massiliensis TaxID=1658110 RepID=UPI0015E0669E|nr:amino acid ABC transporter permease [Haloimpatiens massiliensis]